MSLTKRPLKLFPAALCLLGAVVSFSQDVLPTSSFNGPLNGVAMMPEEFRVNLGATQTENVEFYHLTYKTSTLDLRLLKKYTRFNVPESIVVTPPDLSAFDHTVVLVGLFGDPQDPNIIIWLGGNYHYKNITFFLDYDQDRDFTNDEPPLKVKEGTQPINVVLETERGEQDLWLSVPKANTGLKKEKRRILNKFTLGVTAGAGSGELTYTDSNLATYHDYYVNISEKHFGANVSYYSRYLIVGINASYQNHHFYASYDLEPGGTTATSINVNRDLHSPNKLQLGLLTAARIPLSRFIEFQPSIKIGSAHYTNPEYKKNKFKDEAYALNSSRFIEFGARVEFTVGIENAFFVEFVKNKQDWAPEVLADSNTFDSDMNITKFVVGYNVSLFKKRGLRD